jgi:hypothetical protein
MIRSQNRLSAQARALLERERSIPPQPTAVRARMLARARAALAAGGVSETATANASATASPSRRTWWAAAAVAACVAGVAAGAVAYQAAREHPGTEPTSIAHARPVELVPPAAAPGQATAAPATIPDPTATAARSSTRTHAATADSVREELRLLHRARAAVGRANYAAALHPIGEHARRFPDGKLAEEREALRVKSLAGLGRTEQAQRAAARFEARFPRSVLSPAVSRMPVTPQ